MTANDTHARELLDLALQKMRQGDVAAAIELYDCARGTAESEDVAELITIRKAEAWIALEQEGPEVGQLPQIVMRRRSAYHVYLAAYTLLRKFADQGDRRRALFYGQLARTAAEELGQPRARANVLNALGVALTIDSQFDEAIEAFEDGLGLVGLIPEEEAQEAARLETALRENLAGAVILNGDAARGVPMLEEVLPDIEDDYNIAEALIDLSFGCMQLGRYEDAENYGVRALKRAAVARQIRNANHVLGEIASRTGQHAKASGYYDVVASFYPDFKNVKEVLLAVDVLSVVNWKA